MKKILFKLRQFPHLSETFVLAQIITAIRGGFEVTILVDELLDFKKSTHQQKIFENKINEKIIFEDYNIPKNKFLRLIKVIFIVAYHIERLRQLLEFVSSKKKFSLTWFYQFHFYHKFRDFDVYHVQYGTTSKPLDMLKKIGLLKGRLVVSFHGHDAFFPINGFIPNDGYYKNLFIGDNIIVANTPYLAEIIKSLGCPNENIITIPVGVDTNFFQPSPALRVQDEFRIITVGRLDPIKGHEYGIDAIKILKDKGYPIKFYILGEGSNRKNLEEKISILGLKGTVFLIGSKDQIEVRSFLQQSDLFLFTSIPLKDGRRETQGLATLEAQACGLPVVGFDSGGIKYTFENGYNGYLCNEYDVICLAEKIERLFDDLLRSKMGDRSVESVKTQFSLNVIEQRWAKIYNNE